MRRRARFVGAVIENLANWQFVSKRLVESDRQSRLTDERLSINVVR
ncbi:MAG TPA: hypothetical protein PKE27_13565 [Povalibacter sp.]|nr:hypothetical protein [Povalibacter sp.]HMN45607.1 hypothetical protein [Povalibacter sp.]